MHAMSTPDELTRYLHDHIPLAAAMQLRVAVADGVQLCLEAPLAPNRNPHGTVFGGSLATIAIACGWTLLFDALRCERLEASLVVQRFEADFSAPATGVFRAHAALPEEWPGLVDTLRTRRRARLRLPVVVSCDDRQVFAALASYAARLQPTAHS